MNSDKKMLLFKGLVKIMINVNLRDFNLKSTVKNDQWIQ